MTRLIKSICIGLGVFGLALIFINWPNLKRLSTVNSLFSAHKIVYNFSNMDAAFLHADLEVSQEPFLWPEDIRDLPGEVMINGRSQDLEALLEELDTTAMVIIKDGKLIHESYYQGTQRDDLRVSWSVAKSFMSGLYGIALEQGKIVSLEDSADVYLPSLKGSAYEGISLRHILNMSSGVKFNEDYLDKKSDINKMGRVLALGGSIDDYAQSLKGRDFEAGERWNYVSIDTHIAAMVLRKVTGKSLHELFNEAYGAHLGFGRAPYYLTDGEGTAFALGGLNLRARDYAKFGQLFLNQGRWKGRQVIPEDWVTKSTHHTAPSRTPTGSGYGLQWWVPKPSDKNYGDYYAGGIYGQYIYINPKANLVIAQNCADREFLDPAYGYTRTKNVHVDMFRSLASQLNE